jgi:hypothetical protein
MFQLPIPSLKAFKLFSFEKQVIDIPSVKVYDLENAQEKPARALKHLLKLNHANFAILYNARKFHNHAPHVSFTNTRGFVDLSWWDLADNFGSSSALLSCRVLTRRI